MTTGNYQFVKQAKLVSCQGTTARIATPYTYHLDHLSGWCHAVISQALSTVLARPIQCEYLTLGDLEQAQTSHPTGDARTTAGTPPRQGGLSV